GGNPYLGRHKRGLLLETGFERPEVHAHTRCQATPATTRRAAETFTTRLKGPAKQAIILGEGWATCAELEAMYTAMHEWSERPDALLTDVFLGAFAWAQG